MLLVMREWALQHLVEHFYLAGVDYEDEEKFGQKFADRLGRNGPLYFSKPDGRAESLCTKRQRFSHENEVRLLCVGNEKLGTGPDIRSFAVDPNLLFTEIAFDPRLIAFERLEREQWFRSKGYTGPIKQDSSYVKVLTAIPMPAEWEEPE